ncbi:uncharacterized protein LOC144748577 [Ciona intestinalis]
MFQNARGFHLNGYHTREQHDYAVSVIGQPRQEFSNFPPNFPVRRTTSCIGGLYEQNFENCNGFCSPPPASVVLQDPGFDLIYPEDMSTKRNFTLPLKSNDVEDMVRTFMCCHVCKEVCSRPKQLKCSHTICQQCAMHLRTRNRETGESMIRCKVCKLVTTFYGKSLDGLKDNTAMQKLVGRSGGSGGGGRRGRNGKITMYGDQDMTINIVSYAKEKDEIEKTLQSAEKKIEKCNQQTRYVKEYERSINREKMKIRKEIERAVETYVASIRANKVKLIQDLDNMFEKDYDPVKEAKEMIKVQMQSLKLVTQCCSVGSRILQGGGAPLDLQNFKQMVRKTMKSTKAGHLPAAIHTPYRTTIKFHANDSDFSTLAKHLGFLVDRNRRSKVMEEQRKEEPVKEESEEEPIYDLPPDVQYKQLEQQDSNQAEEESLYDTIPFFDENDELYEDHTQSEESGENSPPKSEVGSNKELPPLPLPPPPPPFMLLNPEDEDLTQKTAEIFARRRAINGYEDTDESEAEDSFSSDSYSEEDLPKEEEQPPSPIRSTRATRSKSYGGNMEDQFPNIQAIDPLQDMNRRRSAGNALNHGRKNSLSMKRSSNKLLYCVGKAVEADLDSGVTPFQVLPEIAVSAEDTLWLTDNQNHRVQAHNGSTGQLTGVVKITSAHNVPLKPKSLTTLYRGRQVAVSSGKCVTLWTKTGDWVRQVGPSPDFGKLGGIAVDSNDNLIMTDLETGGIVINEKRNRSILDVVSAPTSGKTQWLGRIAINTMDQIIVPDYNKHEVNIYNHDGTFYSKFGSFGVANEQFRYPSGVAVDQHNRIYVADECNNRISLYSEEGHYISHVLTKEDGITFPHAVCVFANGNLAVVDDTKVVKVFSVAENQ